MRLTLFYTFHGGMSAVIWTDVVQMALYVGGALLSFWMILQNVPGGWDHVGTGERPVVEAFTVGAERVLGGLVRPGDEPVERHGQLADHGAHGQ